MLVCDIMMLLIQRLYFSKSQVKVCSWDASKQPVRICHVLIHVWEFPTTSAIANRCCISIHFRLLFVCTNFESLLPHGYARKMRDSGVVHGGIRITILAWLLLWFLQTLSFNFESELESELMLSFKLSFCKPQAIRVKPRRKTQKHDPSNNRRCARFRSRVRSRISSSHELNTEN